MVATGATLISKALSLENFRERRASYENEAGESGKFTPSWTLRHTPSEAHRWQLKAQTRAIQSAKGATPRRFPSEAS